MNIWLRKNQYHQPLALIEYDKPIDVVRVQYSWYRKRIWKRQLWLLFKCSWRASCIINKWTNMTFHNANEFSTFPVSPAPLSRITVHEDSKTLLLFFVKHKHMGHKHRHAMQSQSRRCRARTTQKVCHLWRYLSLPFSSRSLRETYSTYFPNELR